MGRISCVAVFSQVSIHMRRTVGWSDKHSFFLRVYQAKMADYVPASASVFAEATTGQDSATY